jgi:hypothetical protein
MKRLLVLFGFFVGFCYCCKKHEPVDYREKFTGKFTFEVISDYWSINPIYNSRDTLTYKGTIKIFTDGDSLNDLNSIDSVKYDHHRFTIEFLQGIWITPEIDENGIIREVTSYRYHHVGGFVNSDSIRFTVDQLGGLGGGRNYYVTGKRD